MTPHTASPLDRSPDKSVPDVASQPAPQPTAGASKSAAVPQRNRIEHVPAQTGAAYWGPGELMTYLLTGEQTQGAYFLSEISVAPGGGAPPHIHHREDESFYLLEGALTMQVGEDTIAASAGDSVYLPRETAHSFRNTGETPAKALVLNVPAGLEGFFAEAFEPAAERCLPPPSDNRAMIARALAAAPRYGMELLPPA